MNKSVLINRLCVLSGLNFEKRAFIPHGQSKLSVTNEVSV